MDIKVQMINMGVYDADTINNLVVNESYYRANYIDVNYGLGSDLFPWSSKDGYNSNSFAHGLLNATNISPITPSYKVPGWIKPLPESYFGR